MNHRGAIMLVWFLILVACGLLALFGTPSPAVATQGGTVIIIAWGSLCLMAGVASGLGLLLHWPAVEVFGLLLGVAVSLLWTAALIIQAVRTGSQTPLTAACVGVGCLLLPIYRITEIHGHGEMRGPAGHGEGE